MAAAGEDLPHPDGYTLDELAERSGTPARTIRFYRDAGLVAAPRRIGRRAYYAHDQLERLQRLAGLRAQGLGLEAAARVLDDPDGARRRLGELLDVGDVLRRPWIEDRPADLDRTQVAEHIGVDDDDVLALLQRFDIVARTSTDPERYHVPSMATLELAGDLAAAGLSPEFAQAAWGAMRTHLGELAADLIRHYVATEGPPETADPEAVRRRFERLRPIALRGVQLVFARQIQAALDAYVTSGGELPPADRTPPDPA